MREAAGDTKLIKSLKETISKSLQVRFGVDDVDDGMMMELTAYPITASFLHQRYKRMIFISESKTKNINHVNEVIEYKHGEETRKSIQQQPVGKEREEAEDENMSVLDCLMGM